MDDDEHTSSSPDTRSRTGFDPVPLMVVPPKPEQLSPWHCDPNRLAFSDAMETWIGAEDEGAIPIEVNTEDATAPSASSHARRGVANIKVKELVSLVLPLPEPVTTPRAVCDEMLKADTS